MRLLAFDAQDVDGLQFDPSGRWLAFTSTKGRVGLLDWRAEEPTPIWLDVASSRFHMICFNPTGTRLMCAAGHGGLSVFSIAELPLEQFNTTKHRCQRIFHDETYGLSCNANLEGQVIGVVSDNTGSRFRYWNWSIFDSEYDSDDGPKALIDLEHEVGRWYANPYLLPDGQHYVCVERRDDVDDSSTTKDWFALRVLETNELLADVRIGAYVTGPISWCETSQTIFAPQNSYIRGWKPFKSEPTTRGERVNHSKSRINWIAIHPSRPRMLIANGQNQIKVLDTETWQVVNQVKWKFGKTRSVAFSPDGLLAAATSHTGKLVFWDFDE